MESHNESNDGKTIPLSGWAFIEYCEEHRGGNTLFCVDCERWVCDQCAAGNHNGCSILSIDDAFVELKKNFARKVKTQLGMIEAENECANSVLKVLEQRRQMARERIDRIYLDMGERVKKLISLGTCINDIQLWTSSIIKLQETLKNLKSTLLETGNSSDLNKVTASGFDAISEQVRRTYGKIVLPREFVCHLNINDLRNLCETGSVYAGRCLRGSPQYGKVVVKGNQIWIHCFQPRQPEHTYIEISFKYLLLRFNKSSKLPKRAFLEVGDDSTIYGNIVIATERLNPRALDFLLLCSGTKKRSYIEYELNNPDWVDAIGIGNGSAEGGAVVKGIRDGGIYEAPRTKGSVEGLLAEDSKISSGFSIIMKDDESWTMTRKFGFVEEGLSFLEGLTEGRGRFFIQHCGLII